MIDARTSGENPFAKCANLPQSVYDPRYGTNAPRCAVAKEVFDYLETNWKGKVFLLIVRGCLVQDDIHFWIRVMEGERGNGCGSGVLKRLTEISDRDLLPLTLQVDGESEVGDWLEGWYRRYGFKLLRKRGKAGPCMLRPVGCATSSERRTDGST